MRLTTNDVATNYATATLDFGFPTKLEGDTATTTVSATWVISTSVIVCSFAGVATTDHGTEDAMVEGLVAYATNIVDGVSFDIQAYAPSGTWGQYVVNAVGI